MKIKFGLFLATMLSTAVLAQTPPPGSAQPTPLPPPPGSSTPAPAPDTSTPATPAPVTPPESTSSSTTNAPAVKKHKKKTAKKKETSKAKEAKHSAPEPIVAEPLLPGESVVAKQNNVNVRGQAHINSEVVGHLQKGEVVTVLEEVTLPHPKTDEPARWAKISLPASLHVWVNNSFIDGTNQTVKARKLNLRT